MHRSKDHQIETMRISLKNTTSELTALKYKKINDILIIGGDFNLPDIDWSSNTISGSKHNPTRVNQTFMDIILELGFEQMVKFSTRLDNTLDLVLTSHPGFMPRCKPLHPISMKNYHDIVLYDTSIQPTRAKPQRRKIYLWKRANINAIRREFRNFRETFLKTSYKTLDEMWNALRASIASAIEKHVPTKLTSNRHTHPWMNTNLWRKTRRKQRAHQRARKTRNPKDWAYYKALQDEVQKETRIAHRNYVQEVVS